MKQSLQNLLAADVDNTGKVCGGCFIKNKKLKESCLEIYLFFFLQSMLLKSCMLIKLVNKSILKLYFVT